MVLPARLTIYTASYALDGGTTTLYAKDEQGHEHRVLLPSKLGWSGLEHDTGEVYFDGEAVPVSSSLELRLLRLLKEAELSPHYSVDHPGGWKPAAAMAVAGEDLKRLFSRTPDENLRWLVDKVIAYLESGA